MKNRSYKKYIVFAAAVLLFAAGFMGAKVSSAATQKLDEITAYYTGGAVEVGGTIDKEDIYVMAQYTIYDTYGTDISYEDVKSGFTISPSVITKEGANTVVVTYRGKSAEITVEGKVVESLYADYTGSEVYVGASISTKKIDVTAYFSDGSTKTVKDFTVSSLQVYKEGINTFTVIYGGKTAEIYVYGKAPLAVEEIMAYYLGDPVIEGNSIPKSEVEVVVFYNDGTMKEVSNFNMQPSIAEEEGYNEIVISYGGVSTTIEVYALERTIEDMTAKYTGPGVLVGEKVEKDDIKVTVTYNDGSTEDIDDFDMFGDDILWEGENVVIVYCDSYTAEIVVYGVKGFAVNYDNALTKYFFSYDYYDYSEVTLGMNMWVEMDKFELRELDPEIMALAVQRVVPTEEFIAFELFYDDDEMVLEFPMAMKVTVPDSYDPDCIAVYYTPNQSTIMARIDGQFVDEDQEEYQFIVYEPGAYVLVHEVSSILVEEIVVEEEVEIKVNRNYSLNPVVFPLYAENKELTFWSSDEDVATVSENGKIKTHQVGECEIWIETTDGSGVYVIVNVEVVSGR